MDVVKLPKVVEKIINSPGTVKAVSTIGDDGMPHTVFKHSMRVLDEGTIAFMEMIENSRTTQNILNLINVEEDKKLPLISISLLDPEKSIAYEMKCQFDRFVVEGPLWRAFLKETWKVFPDMDPVGVWTFKPVAVANQSLNVRVEEEGNRLEPHGNFWFTYLGPRNLGE